MDSEHGLGRHLEGGTTAGVGNMSPLPVVVIDAESCADEGIMLMCLGCFRFGSNLLDHNDMSLCFVLLIPVIVDFVPSSIPIAL